MATKEKPKAKEKEKAVEVDVARSYDRRTIAKGPKMGKMRVFLFLILFAGLVILVRGCKESKSSPRTWESSVQKTIPSLTRTLLLLPGEKVTVIKAYRVFQDGTKEMLEYSVDIPSNDRGSVIDFSAQGENGAEGDHNLRGDRFSLDKDYTLAGANDTNWETHYLKFQNVGTVPFTVTVYLKGKDRFTVFPDGKIVPMPWE